MPYQNKSASSLQNATDGGRTSFFFGKKMATRGTGGLGGGRAGPGEDIPLTGVQHQQLAEQGPPGYSGGTVTSSDTETADEATSSPVHLLHRYKRQPPDWAEKKRNKWYENHF